MAKTHIPETLPKPIYWRYRDVQAFLNRSRSSIYQLVCQEQTFPKPFHISERIMGWFRTDIEKWAREWPDILKARLEANAHNGRERDRAR